MWRSDDQLWRTQQGAPSLTNGWVLWVFPNLKFSVMLPDGFFRLGELEFSLNPNISPDRVGDGWAAEVSHISGSGCVREKNKRGRCSLCDLIPNWESITCKCVLENGSMMIENMVIYIHRLDNVREMDLWLNCFSNMCIKICDMGPHTQTGVWEKKDSWGSPTNHPSNY